MAGEEITLILVTLGMVLSIVGSTLVYASRYKRVPPNMAMVVFGRRQAGEKGFSVVTGGGRFVLPIVEEVAWLDLSITAIEMRVEDVVTDVTRSRVRINIAAVADGKISSDPESLRRAAENFLHTPREELLRIIRQTLEGHLRGTCATLKPQEVASDRKRVADRVREVAAVDLGGMGLEVRTFVLTSIEDPEGYLAALKEQLRPNREAEIRAYVRQDATVALAPTDQQSARL